MAVVKTLDNASVHAGQSKKSMIVFWDFSNAFCTTIHEITIDIAKKYALSDRMTTLLKQFLEQSFTTIKMSDKDGFYLSEPSHTGRGGPQGQIGSDFIFALVNDGIDPEPIADEIIDRTKYVDDFTDVFSANTVKELLASLEFNEKLIKRQATSVGLKLNDDKTKIICINFLEDELPKHLPDYKERFKNAWELLGFEFEVVQGAASKSKKPENSSKRSVDFVSGDRTADELIGRLNAGVRLINTLRKVSNDIEMKVDAATKLVWSSCYDIGLVYAYASQKKFKAIETCIRKLIRSAGLDNMMSSDLVYQCSTRLPPLLMAKKQMIQLGIKFLDPDRVRDNRFLIEQTCTDYLRPFWSKFLKEFNSLPLELRKEMIENLNVLDKAKMQIIKTRLRSFYRKEFSPSGILTKEKRETILTKNLYSRLRVEKRKCDAANLKFDRDHSTPVGKRKSCSSITFMQNNKLCYAPMRDVRMSQNPRLGSQKVDDTSEPIRKICFMDDNLCSPATKRKISPDSGSMAKKYKKDTQKVISYLLDPKTVCRARPSSEEKTCEPHEDIAE